MPFHAEGRTLVSECTVLYWDWLGVIVGATGVDIVFDAPPPSITTPFPVTKHRLPICEPDDVDETVAMLGFIVEDMVAVISWIAGMGSRLWRARGAPECPLPVAKR